MALIMRVYAMIKGPYAVNTSCRSATSEAQVVIPILPPSPPGSVVPISTKSKHCKTANLSFINPLHCRYTAVTLPLHCRYTAVTPIRGWRPNPRLPRVPGQRPRTRSRRGRLTPSPAQIGCRAIRVRFALREGLNRASGCACCGRSRCRGYHSPAQHLPGEIPRTRNQSPPPSPLATGTALATPRSVAGTGAVGLTAAARGGGEKGTFLCMHEVAEWTGG